MKPLTHGNIQLFSEKKLWNESITRPYQDSCKTHVNQLESSRETTHSTNHDLFLYCCRSINTQFWGYFP